MKINNNKGGAKRLKMKAILVTNNGMFKGIALVDDIDFDIVNQYKWHLNDSGYAVHSFWNNGKPVIARMHRLILGLKSGDGIQTDHINRDKLDTRRENLRTVTHKQNGQNVPSQIGTSSYRGVSWDKTNHKWVAQVVLDRKNYKLGRFNSELEAAVVAQQWRQKHMPYSEEQIIKKEVVWA